MKEVLEQIGIRVRESRQSLGLTQEKLAERASLNTSYVGQIERGLREPSLRALHKLAGALNLTLSELLAEDLEEEEMLQGEVTRLLEGWSPEQQKVILKLLQDLEELKPS